ERVVEQRHQRRQGRRALQARQRIEGAELEQRLVRLEQAAERAGGVFASAAAERLGGRNADVQIGVVEGGDQRRHRALVADLEQHVGGELALVGVFVREQLDQRGGGDGGKAHQRLGGGVARAGLPAIGE